MTLPSRLFHLVGLVTWGACGLFVALTLTPAWGQRPADRPSSPAANSQGLAIDTNLQIGIGGVYRPGHWTAVRRLHHTAVSADASSPGTYLPIAQIETWDGEGVRVAYTQPPLNVDSVEAATWAYVSPGMAGAPLRLSVATGDQPIDDRFGDGAIEPQTPWVVVIGDSMAIETIGRNDLLGRQSSVAVSQVQSVGQLPDQAIGWSGVDLLVINRAGRSLLAGLSPRQTEAISGWLRGGGRVLWSPGSSGDDLLGDVHWLAELAGLAVDPGTVQIDPAGLETFTSSQTRLPVLTGIALRGATGQTAGRALITGRNVQRQPLVLATENVVGLGRITTTSFALDSAELAAWPQRLTLIHRLLPGLLESDNERRREARTAASAPYDDLAGQVRAALDRFDTHYQVPFSILSALLLTLIALVGPLDYLLINRFFGKPLLGWVSFPLSTLAIAAILVAMSKPAIQTPSGTPQRENRMEVIDIASDGQQALVRVTSIGHLYSRQAALVDFAPSVNSAWTGTAMADASLSVLSRPYGYAGTTFGGIMIAGEDQRLPVYQTQLASSGSQAAPSLGSQLVGLPLAPAGSKGIVSTLSFPLQLGRVDGLAKRRGSELLTGQLTNPLPVDVLDGALVYGNWVYLLPTRFRVGQTIESIDTLRQKNFRWHLLRRVAMENGMTSDHWDAEMFDDLPRLTEILMFEQAVGGRDYTGLSNRPWKSLDLSYLLASGQAILYGRTETPLLQTDVTAEQTVASAVRVVLPVAPAAER